MPKIGSVGYSGNTPLKQVHFQEILGMHLKIVKHIFNKDYLWHEKVYYYYDLTSGAGRVNGDLGSPLIFMRSIHNFNMPIDAHFIEKDEDAFASLMENTNDGYRYDGQVKLFNDPYEAVLKQLVQINYEKDHYGLLYVDANGMPPDFESIINFFKKKHNKRIDLMIHCPTTSLKRVRKSSRHPSEKYLAEILLEIDKEFWIIREPFHQWGWTFLIGTNWDAFPEFVHINFYRLSSNEGMKIFEWLNFTADELNERNFYRNYPEYLQHPIFQLIRRERFAFARKNTGHRYGKTLCEVCKKEVATESHHLIYAPWGYFDVLNNIIAVCHRCHCKLENKEN